MKVRLTQVPLRVSAELEFAIGSVLTAGEHVTAEYLQDLVTRGLAIISTGDGSALTPELEAAIAAYQEAAAALGRAVVFVVDHAEQGPPGSAEAALRVLRLDPPGLAELAPRLDALGDLAWEEREAARAAEEEHTNSASAGSPVSDDGAPVPPLGPGAAEPDMSKSGAEGGAGDGPAPPVVSSGPAAADTNAPPPPVGADGDAGAPAPADPAAQTSPPDAKQSARKGKAAS